MTGAGREVTRAGGAFHSGQSHRSSMITPKNCWASTASCLDYCRLAQSIFRGKRPWVRCRAWQGMAAGSPPAGSSLCRITAQLSMLPSLQDDGALSNLFAGTPGTGMQLDFCDVMPCSLCYTTSRQADASHLHLTKLCFQYNVHRHRVHLSQGHGNHCNMEAVRSVLICGPPCQKNV